MDFSSHDFLAVVLSSSGAYESGLLSLASLDLLWGAVPMTILIFLCKYFLVSLVAVAVWVLLFAKWEEDGN